MMCVYEYGLCFRCLYICGHCISSLFFTLVPDAWILFLVLSGLGSTMALVVIVCMSSANCDMACMAKRRVNIHRREDRRRNSLSFVAVNIDWVVLGLWRHQSSGFCLILRFATLYLGIPLFPQTVCRAMGAIQCVLDPAWRTVGCLGRMSAASDKSVTRSRAKRNTPSQKISTGSSRERGKISSSS